MKKAIKYSLLVATAVLVFSCNKDDDTPKVTALGNVDIPDANFLAALIDNPDINTNGDNEIQVSEAENYTGIISVSNKNISDMTGIEAFINITRLSFFNNNVTSIDVSKNTKITQFLGEENNLTTLDLSNNALLTDIKAHVNSLTSINIANGNNHNVTRFVVDSNICVQTDAGITFPRSGWSPPYSVVYQTTPCVVNQNQ